MTEEDRAPTGEPLATYYVDEAGDGVLYGRMGRDRLKDSEAHLFFILGMVRCANDHAVEDALAQLRKQLRGNPLYATIHSMRPEAEKTARFFHAKDDHAEVRARVFEFLQTLDFKFFAVIKDMRAVKRYVEDRNRIHSDYRYHPNELYDFTVRMLFKERLHKHERNRIVFARRGKADRTRALTTQLEETCRRFRESHQLPGEPTLEVVPAYPWQAACLQIADYCLWALQRCYERYEARFLHTIWPKVSLIRDVDDTREKPYGRYLSRIGDPPDPEEIKKSRWI